MKTRGMGRVFRYGYKNPKTRVRKLTAIWWIQYSYRGKPYRESSHSTNRNVAVRLLRRRLAEIGQGRLIGPDVEKTTYEDLEQMLLDDYRINGRKSLERAEASAKRLREFFGGSRALDITSDRIAAYIRARLEARVKSGTIANELIALKRMFTLALRAGKVALRPYIPSLDSGNIRQGFFEAPEFQAVLTRLPEDIQPLVEFLYLTGWRVGEVLPLEWRQVDFEVGIVQLEPGTTKNDEGRTFPFSVLPSLEALLRRQRERTLALERATGQIIPSVFHRQGNPIKSFRGAWKRACKAAGLAGRIPHDFRRTAVRNLERAGVPRSVAMKLTGHKTESIYRRYAIVSEADLREGVGKLAALHQAASTASRTVLPLREGFGKHAQTADQRPERL